MLLVGRLTRSSTFVASSRRYYSTKGSKPLRILFCGSDGFSSASLQALHNEQKRDPNSIASIDVLCRPGKKSGRGMKNIREVPIKAVAQTLGLPIHERDTFTGWELPKPNGESINLIVAVSFGLFVPARILKSTEYGGLNVHPSILPARFRGPAPIHHFLLSGATSTGVSLQTLDEKSFDRGVILARSAEINREPSFSYGDVLSRVTPEAADLLVKGVRDRLFVPPLVEIDPPPMPDTIKNLHAPKIVPEDRRINWNWSADAIARRYLALGPLWTEVTHISENPKRWIFDGIQAVPISDIVSDAKEDTNEDVNSPDAGLSWHTLPTAAEGVSVSYCALLDKSVVFRMTSDTGVRVKSITVAGGKKSPAALVLSENRDHCRL